jgi:YD repeat-containing protein
MQGTLPSNIGSFQAGSRAVIRTRTSYDANGRVVALTDDRGGQTTYAYDLLDRQTSMTFADGSTRTSQYNLAGDLTGYTDENGLAFANTYDALDRCTDTGMMTLVGTRVVHRSLVESVGGIDIRLRLYRSRRDNRPSSST